MNAMVDFVVGTDLYTDTFAYQFADAANRENCYEIYCMVKVIFC